MLDELICDILKQMEGSKKTWWIVGAIVLLGLTIFTLRQEGMIDLEAIGEWVQDLGVVGYIVYGILFTVFGMLGLSKVAMTVLAGVLFGFVEAMIITVIAATIAATLGFFVARYFHESVHERINKRISKKQNGKIQSLIYRIEQNAEERGFIILSVLRLSFVPLMMTSYASGLIHTLRFRDFFWAIFLTNIYMHFVYIFIGTSFRENLPLFILAVMLLILFYQTPKIIKQLRQKFDA